MVVVDVAVGIIRDKTGRVLIAQRKEDVHQGGLWEFPGGKIEAEENVEQGLRRELYEELGITFKCSSALITIRFNYPECYVCLHVRDVNHFEGSPTGKEGQLIKWVSEDVLNKYDFPKANRPIISAIKLGQDYAIIGGKNISQVLKQLDKVSKKGVKLVQIRCKEIPKFKAEEVCDRVRLKCHELGITYLINSQMPVSAHLNDGLHLTSADLMNLDKRPETSGLVAASCHNLQELRQAECLALDFAVLSPVMMTASHPEAMPLGWKQFEEWVSRIKIPIFALGGLRESDYKKVRDYGGQGISGIRLYELS